MLQEYDKFPNWLIDVEKGTIYSLYYKKYIGSIGKDGYVFVTKQKGYKHRGLHQYIWMCVNGDIPEGYDIHHIDGNKQNNSIYNLELIERHKHLSEHKIGKHHSEEHIRKLSKKVAQYSLYNVLVKVWESAMECGRNGFDQGNVSKCCNGERKTHKGYKWKYYEGTNI